MAIDPFTNHSAPKYNIAKPTPTSKKLKSNSMMFCEFCFLEF